MEGEAPLKDEQKQLPAGANQKEDDANDYFFPLIQALRNLEGIYIERVFPPKAWFPVP